MLVVSDTSAITNLMHIGQLNILRALFKQIYIPPAVYSELCVLEIQKKKLENQNWIIIHHVTERVIIEQFEKDLDIGEVEAIALAFEFNADYLLIDELKGRKFAEKLGLKVVGLLGILIKAKREKVIPKVKPLVEMLINSAGFRIHPELYTEVLKIADELQ